jgi:hypothetical protein
LVLVWILPELISAVWILPELILAVWILHELIWVERAGLHLVAQAWDSGKQFIGDRRIQ